MEQKNAFSSEAQFKTPIFFSLFKEGKRDVYDFCIVVTLKGNTLYCKDKIYNDTFMGSKKVSRMVLLFFIKNFKVRLRMKYPGSFLSTHPRPLLILLQLIQYNVLVYGSGTRLPGFDLGSVTSCVSLGSVSSSIKCA